MGTLPTQSINTTEAKVRNIANKVLEFNRKSPLFLEIQREYVKYHGPIVFGWRPRDEPGYIRGKTTGQSWGFYPIYTGPPPSTFNFYHSAATHGQDSYERTKALTAYYKRKKLILLTENNDTFYYSVLNMPNTYARFENYSTLYHEVYHGAHAWEVGTSVRYPGDGPHTQLELKVINKTNFFRKKYLKTPLRAIEHRAYTYSDVVSKNSTILQHRYDNYAYKYKKVKIFKG